MSKKIIAGGCSFTLGNELSDDKDGKTPSNKSWAKLLVDRTATNFDFVNVAFGGLGNSAIARRVFRQVANEKDVKGVVVMWTFLSRYDWAMPRHKFLEDTRWASISPWETNAGEEQAFRELSGSIPQQQHWQSRKESFKETGVKDFAESIYRYAANQYHETYLSWKSIIWLQNILLKKKIPFMFTLADNSLFYDEFKEHKNQDDLMTALHGEIDFTKWFSFGERMMGFNQWAMMEEYPRGTTHPLDEAHQDAVNLMLPMFNKLIGDKK
tara:strand:- start:931 stop:1734 length:804 start_codon:yes stop_codon:yes gene_type:complete